MQNSAVISFMEECDQLRQTLESLRQSSDPPLSVDARSALEATIATTQATAAASQNILHPPNGLQGVLTAASSFETLKNAQKETLRSLSALVSGLMPLTRTSKDELSTFWTHLHSSHVELSIAKSDAAKLWDQLKKLYLDIISSSSDIDIIEAKLDDIIRRLISTAYDGEVTLAAQDFRSELSMLQAKITLAEKCPQNGQHDEEGVLRLVVNSLERLHDGVHNKEEEEAEPHAREEAEVDDEDDPFFMPLPAALRMADASNFYELSQPLNSGSPSPFLLALDLETPSTQEEGLCVGFDEGISTQVGCSDGEDLCINTASSEEEDCTVFHHACLPTDSATSAKAVAAAAASLLPAKQPDSLEFSLKEGAAQVPDSAKEDSSVQTANPSLDKFVDFLSGKVATSRFQEKMRLSMEGCQKLSKFLAASDRIRALSLSENFIGDEGVRILCEGLKTNTSIISLELPHNDVSDAGAEMLTQVLKGNPSLTQLQLSNNKISDIGAVCLAQLIRDSRNLKKLGLSYNNIGTVGCKALKDAIDANKSLKQLQLLPGNPVTIDEAKGLAKAIQRNNSFSIRTFLRMDSLPGKV